MHIKVILSLSCTLLFFLSSFAQTDQSEALEDAGYAKEAFLKEDDGMADFFDNAYGFAIFPKVGKGAFVVGGAGGRGVVYEQGNPIGEAKLTQVTIGAQAGGQSYREVIFFEDAAAFKNFKKGKMKLSAQVSAVAAAAGASADAPYQEGVIVFTMPIGGLMYEASVGGQKFKVDLW